MKGEVFGRFDQGFIEIYLFKFIYWNLFNLFS